MMIHVHFFALAREIAGSSSIVVELPSDATVGTLRLRLAQQYPNMARLIERSALAVNKELAHDKAVLSPQAEVALLPPVSGG